MLERAREGVAVANEQGYPYWQLMGQLLPARSKAWATKGVAEATQVGVGHMRKLHHAYGASGARTGETLWLLQVVTTLLRAGMFDQGMETITQALDTIEATGERTWEAEFYRLRGELHRKMSDPDPVQTEDTLVLPLTTPVA